MIHWIIIYIKSNSSEDICERVPTDSGRMCGVPVLPVTEWFGFCLNIQHFGRSLVKFKKKSRTIPGPALFPFMCLFHMSLLRGFSPYPYQSNQA